MKDSDAARLNNNLGRLVEELQRMNNNHIEIGRLFKSWTETENPEVEELELPDRPAFTIGKVVRMTDHLSVHYKHVGVITKIGRQYLLVHFLHSGEADPVLTAGQVEILDQPPLFTGNPVRVIDPHSMMYNRFGVVLKPGNANDLAVEVGFGEKSAGMFERRNLELVESIQFEVDDIVDVVEERSAFVGRTGTVIGIRKNGEVRVMFQGQEGYSIFTAGELVKSGEQPYKEV